MRIWAACPGRTASEFASVALGRPGGAGRDKSGEPTAKIVRNILKGLDRDRPFVLAGASQGPGHGHRWQGSCPARSSGSWSGWGPGRLRQESRGGGGQGGDTTARHLRGPVKSTRVRPRVYLSDPGIWSRVLMPSPLEHRRWSQLFDREALQGFGWTSIRKLGTSDRGCGRRRPDLVRGSRGSPCTSRPRLLTAENDPLQQGFEGGRLMPTPMPRRSQTAADRRLLGPNRRGQPGQSNGPRGRIAMADRPGTPRSGGIAMAMTRPTRRPPTSRRPTSTSPAAAGLRRRPASPT